MATVVWNGDGDGVSISDGDNWVGDVAPVNNDTIIINATDDAIAGAVTTLTGIVLKIGPGFTGTIGSSSTYLDIDGTTIDFASGGTSCYLTGTWSGTITVKDGVSSSTMLDFKGNASTDLATVRIVGGNGTVTIGDNAVLDDLEVIDAPSITVDVGDVSSLDNVIVDSGEVDIGGGIATICQARGGDVTISGTGTVAQLDVEGIASVAYNTSGACTTLNCFGGLTDFRNNTSSSVTITNCTIHEGATLDLQSGIENVTLSNGIVYYGGEVRFPLGSTLTITV